ncbi:MAG TPA: hypothetical protein VE197_00865, partial [Mycobacterium sp.]|nr:hypothetical protein [Mycobacterium sp.]
LQVPLPGVAAIAYDAGRGKLWACDSPTGGNSPGSGTEVYLIDPATGSATDEFGTRGCWDGLAYDAADDTLWTSPDMSDTIYHYRSDGALIGSFSGLTKSLGGVGNSGIAVGGSDLYLSNADGDTVYATPKDFSTQPVPVATDPDHTEDMECDSVTFAPADAMWVISAFDRTLNAYEIPAGSCGVGGQTLQHTPTALTRTPPVVKSTGATFSGSVNPSGLPTSAHFEYGLDSRYTKPGTSGPVYDHSTPARTLGSDFVSHAVSEQISGLVPNALYHVRLVATNSAGTTFGPDVAFRTQKSAPPPAPKLGRTFNIKPVRGTVLIKIHGVYVPLTQARQIPQNTPINALHGTLRLISAAPGGAGHPAHDAAAKHKRHSGNKHHRGKGKRHKHKTKTQSGTFGGAVFKISQTRGGRNRGLV